MRRFLGKVIIGLAVLCAVGTARPASAQTFAQQLTYLRDNIRGPWLNCFICDGAQTVLNLLNGAEIQRNAGNITLSRAIIQQAIMCVDQPSRQVDPVAAFVLGPPRNIIINGTGVRTPISVQISFMAGYGSVPPNLPGPVLPVYKFFSYGPINFPGIIDLDRYFACRTEAHDPLREGLGVLATL